MKVQTTVAHKKHGRVRGKAIIWQVGFVLCSIVALGTILPQHTYAQCGTAGNPSCPDPIKLVNPLVNINDIATFLRELINIAIMFGIPIAVFFIILSGFMFVTAQGNPAKLASARKALLAAVIGTAILLGAWVIATAIKGTIDAIRGGP